MRHLHLLDILAAVAHETGVSHYELASPSRSPRLVHARWLYAGLAWAFTGYSGPEIAERIHKAHSNVWVWVASHRRRMQEPEYTAMYRRCVRMMGHPPKVERKPRVWRAWGVNEKEQAA